MLRSRQRFFVAIIGGLAALAMVACSQPTPQAEAEGREKTPAEANAKTAQAAAPKEVAITTGSEEARKLYLQGRDLVEKIRFTDGNKYFHQAVEKDPDFAL